jgi:hypothetical protein
MVFAALYAVVVGGIGLIIGRGNIFVAVLFMFGVGILLRIWAYRRIRRAGADRPPWWKWL